MARGGGRDHGGRGRGHNEMRMRVGLWVQQRRQVIYSRPVFVRGGARLRRGSRLEGRNSSRRTRYLAAATRGRRHRQASRR